MRLLITFLTLSIATCSMGQSVLSNGQWYKMGLTKEGIYKLDKNFLMKEVGINAGFDPRTLKIYGTRHGGMLPQANSVERFSDPQQFAIWGVGDQDGRLDDQDYFLFYSEGPDKLMLDSSGAPVYENNLYSDTLYYFITTGGEPGKRITTAEIPAPTGSVTTSYYDYITHEIDIENQLRSGRQWLGEKFKKNQDAQQSFEYTLSGSADSVEVWVSVAANSEGPCSFDVSVNNNVLGNIPLEAIQNGVYGEKIKYNAINAKTQVSGNKVTLTLTFQPASGVDTSLGFLDFFVMAIKRKINLGDDKEMIIRLAPGSLRTFEISQATNQSQVWDITDPLNARRLNSSIVNSKIQFSNQYAQHTFVAFDGNDFPSPTYFHPIGNQNIKSLAGNEGLIVTHPDFLDAANRLAAFHQSYSGLSVGVVTTSQVYNEFSAGRQDLTAIRDYARYCYLKSGKIKYLLLFGDASYDYKDRLSNNTNFVPVYESHESAHNILSHSSDDYFGFMEEDEGTWYEGERKENSSTTFLVPYQDHTMDIGVGRLPVKTPEEAHDVVDKIIRYKTATQVFGKWRDQIAYFSDDGDRNAHMIQAEQFFQIVDTTAIEYTARKLYLDLYDQSKDLNPSPAQEAFQNTIKDGVFMLNYMGHGNESQLTEENVITLSVIRNLTNRHKLPLFITATCQFGKYDSPILVSGAERLLLNPNGGAIALLTTTRPVYAHTNFPVNQALHENLFKKIDGRHPRLGDIIRLTKNASLSGPINRNFSLLGDPMLTLNYPEHNISFDQMEAEQDTLSALEVYRLSGKITSQGALVPGFSGKAIVTLWDIPQEKVTKGQESDPFTYSDQTNSLFRGEITVTDGRFDTEFILPKNISHKFQPGKLTMYAWNENERTDASGASRNFVLGGIADQVSEDNTPPRIKVFINDSTFSPGGTVGTNSLLIANLSDETGINISDNGFNQGITLRINSGDEIVLNEFYTAHTDTYKSGTVLFPLQNLEAGRYTATLKVFDAHNNAAETTVEFKVSEKPIIRLYNAINYPNPVSQAGETTFRFEHDREDEELEVKISLYNMRGELVQESNFQVDSSPRAVDHLTIRASNYQGAPLDKGIYLYRLKVTSTLDDATNEVIKRLIIIN